MPVLVPFLQLGRCFDAAVAPELVHLFRVKAVRAVQTRFSIYQVHILVDVFVEFGHFYQIRGRRKLDYTNYKTDPAKPIKFLVTFT